MRALSLWLLMVVMMVSLAGGVDWKMLTLSHCDGFACVSLGGYCARPANATDVDDGVVTGYSKPVVCIVGGKILGSTPIRADVCPPVTECPPTAIECPTITECPTTSPCTCPYCPELVSDPPSCPICPTQLLQPTASCPVCPVLSDEHPRLAPSESTSAEVTSKQPSTSALLSPSTTATVPADNTSSPSTYSSIRQYLPEIALFILGAVTFALLVWLKNRLRALCGRGLAGCADCLDCCTRCCWASCCCRSGALHNADAPGVQMTGIPLQRPSSDSARLNFDTQKPLLLPPASPRDGVGYSNAPVPKYTLRATPKRPTNGRQSYSASANLLPSTSAQVPPTEESLFVNSQAKPTSSVSERVSQMKQSHNNHSNYQKLSTYVPGDEWLTGSAVDV